MNTKVIVTRVGNPDQPQTKANGKPDAGVVKREDGTSFRWFQLEVSQRRGIERITAIRNFAESDRHGIDREDALAAMESKDDLGNSGIEVVTVAIEPRETPFTDPETGEVRMQTHATVIKLPSEDLSSALRATNAEYRLLGSASRSDAPAVDEDLSEDELAKAAVAVN